jgi:hypothetical protein
LRWECPPEGAKSLQGYIKGIMQCIPPTGFTKFHKDLNFSQRRENGASLPSSQRDKRVKGEERQLTEGKRRGAQGHRSTAGEDGRRWRSPARGKSPDAESWAAGRRHRASGSARSGWGRFFKTRDGHTGQSTVPVRCTPDSAQ